MASHNVGALRRIPGGLVWLVAGLVLGGILMTLVSLALLSPAVGNVFSTVNNLSGSGSQPDARGSTSALVMQTTATGLALALPSATQAAPAGGVGGSGALPNTGGGGGGGGAVAFQPTPAPQQRVILRDATLRITVMDTQAKIDAITALVNGMGGWVVSSSTSTRAHGALNVLYGTMVVRVPAEQLDAALSQIKDDVVHVTGETITGQDVTQDYVDTQLAVRSLEGAIAQLETLLAQAETVAEVLAVYDELIGLRQQIDVMRGRLQYYDQASAFSSITINLDPFLPTLTPTPSSTVYPTITPTGWDPARTIDRALDQFTRTAQGTADTAITGTIVCLPFAIPVVLVLGFGWRAWRSRARRAAAGTPNDGTPGTGAQ